MSISTLSDSQLRLKNSCSKSIKSDPVDNPVDISSTNLYLIHPDYPLVHSPLAMNFPCPPYYDCGILRGMATMKDRILDLLNTEGPMTFEEIQAKLKYKSKYTYNTVRDLCNLDLVTKVNDKYVPCSEKELLSNKAEEPKYRVIPMTSWNLVEYILDRKPELPQLDPSYIERALGLYVWYLTAHPKFDPSKLPVKPYNLVEAESQFYQLVEEISQ